MTTADDRYLPGSPSKRLLTSVRRTLKGYGMRPHNLTLWRDTWAWALAVRNSYLFHQRWPNANEIAAQYVTLLLADMRATPGFRLPFRATEKQTPAVQARLAAAAGRALPGAQTTEPKLLPPAEPPAA
ncbi:hypothetical protein GobsT_71110 [Gemmata obscuriglobus]|uniref:Uncharacterized protein n=1 Tax=Gemmata obscuriglobus TaxID=114 RepID=A0A2Z3HBL3_9BACT|nr:hypothetical protein [Gemmata obscuriglobus]AWM41782.1 hypothetical protein C1280_35495 [Gemmata obscuriglobus]QEG32258.1 hypothetical protein GobsT_71110 [Gemmata obscuriglobus]VTS11614.1 Uncharacterized protein OS=Planctomyces brasiliensis (strain ATCC 49424 / DSM 5305 / JCM 21570 / NBRC 103401 / IFAM 1448) GN=Plabr_0948 PE=4 SV=1 [Gemmata obscuriglobus UQM 2246]